MKMYKWFFEGFDIKFISSEDKLDRHIQTNRTRLDAHDKKVIIEHEYTDDNTATADCVSCTGSPKSKRKSSVSDVPKTNTTGEQETPGLFSMSGDVVPTPTPTTSLEDDLDLGLLNGTSDSVAE